MTDHAGAPWFTYRAGRRLDLAVHPRLPDIQDRRRFSARGMAVLCVDTVAATGIVAS